jgi:replicative DNA helicase
MDGLRDEELILLAARPSVGKSALAGEVVKGMAMKASIPSLFVSLEMNRLQLYNRWLSSESRVPLTRIRRSWTMNPEEVSRLNEAHGRIRQAPVWIDDGSMQTVQRIGALARRLKRRNGLRLVVVDYLQLITPEDRRVHREQQVAGMSRTLKNLARELKIPFLVLCQLNREVESRAHGKPRLADLRESGALEQDADVVLFLHRDEAEKPKPVWAVTADVAKNRNGQIGDTVLAFEVACQRFTEYDAPATAQPFRNGD